MGDSPSVWFEPGYFYQTTEDTPERIGDPDSRVIAKYTVAQCKDVVDLSGGLHAVLQEAPIDPTALSAPVYVYQLSLRSHKPWQRCFLAAFSKKEIDLLLSLLNKNEKDATEVSRSALIKLQHDW